MKTEKTLSQRIFLDALLNMQSEESHPYTCLYLEWCDSMAQQTLAYRRVFLEKYRGFLESRGIATDGSWREQDGDEDCPVRNREAWIERCEILKELAEIPNWDAEFNKIWR